MAYLALYRKYRPKTFDEVVGQDSITRILKNQIQYNRVGHAYLFSGIRGTGKTSLAKIFAKAINCPNSIDGNPCNQCEVCLKIDRPGVMDIIEIDGASNRGVDEIREIREKIKYPPTVGQYKVYIIDEVHMLTKEAFNALLKTLEEPPAHAVFILATTEPNKCPTTILSRCQRYEIRPIPKALIIGQMKKICNDLGVTMSEQSFDFIATRGENSMRDALSLLDQIIDLKDSEGCVSFDELLAFTGMADKTNIHDLVLKIIKGDSSGVLVSLRDLVSHGKESLLLMDQLIEYLRGILITKTAKETAKDILICTTEDFEAYREIAEKITFAKLYQMITQLIDEKNKLKYSSLQSIIVEMALLKLCLEDEAPDTEKQKKMQSTKKEIKTIEEEPKANYKIDRLTIDEKHSDTQKPSVEEISPEIIKIENDEEKKEIPQQTQVIAESQKKVQNEEKKLPQNNGSKHDEMRFFKKLCDEIGKTNSAQAMFLKRGEAILQNDDHLDIIYTTENKNYFQFVNKPEFIKSFETILSEATERKITVAVRLEEDNFSKMDLTEKTRRIVNNDDVKIIKNE
ncbi:DNA polymerase III subunit gamma/tau [Acetobacterium paludosum]|uniref:DNA-directed DNA polymerase n=1 Tax=Acetobacterium paludosum TaxID=52693 RepID=A0A923HT53_9FIRM|nr:DNA polymerase III subunit gamma/tau [Acetobacterium paludosum]MBC3887282.1 DNA polymerase III subunit gamma/tau [Acetobacterium paludosum]